MDLSILAYVFMMFVVGIGCVGAVLVLTRLQDALARAFLLFYMPLTVLVLAALLLALAEATVSLAATLWVLEYLEGFVGRYSVMLTLPLFAHRIFGLHSGRRDGLIVAIVVAALVGQHITEFLLGGAWDRRGDVAEDLAFAGVVVYTLAVVLGCPAEHAVYPPLARRFIFMLLIGLPVVAHDVFVVDGPGLRLYPFWYCALGVTMIRTLVARRSGATGIIPDEWNLSDREKEVLRLVQQGLSNQAIALRLSISPNTVKTHLRAIFDKSGFRTRVALIAASPPHPIG